LPRHRATAFGLSWQSDFLLDHFAPQPDAPCPADVTVRQVAALQDRTILRTINRGALCTDGFRFTWDDQAAIDVYGGDRVEVLPLSGWQGTLPWAFYSTVAALLLAGRGQVPFHACGVAIGGSAVLICGPSGAGKSTLAAGLVQHGAGFIADDLCAIDPADGTPRMLPGRPAVRLFAEVATRIGAADPSPIPGDPRGKVIAALGASQRAAALPLGLIVLLQDEPVPGPLALRFATLSRQLFRPKWLTRMPGHAEREYTVRAIVTAIPMIVLPPLGPIDAATFGPRCQVALQAIAAALDPLRPAR
jgi:hypothetical protein